MLRKIMSEGLDLIFQGLDRIPIPDHRPRVTLTYAQSVDGSIAAVRGQPLALSGQASLRMTHRLRSLHDGILVGIGTLIADNPRLTARNGFSPNPKPIILDTRLRTPPDAEVLTGPMRPIIATAIGRDGESQIEVREATVLQIPQSESGTLQLPPLLEQLRIDHSVKTLMVEGGARVIRSFLSSRLVDFCIITVAPILVSGLEAARGAVGPGGIRFSEPIWAILGDDAVVAGELAWPTQ